MRFFLCLLMTLRCCLAQAVVRIPGPGGSSGVVVVPITLINSLTYQANNTNSSSIDTTGATLTFIATTCYTANTVPNIPTDSFGNTYTAISYYGGGGVVGLNIKGWYKIGPTPGVTTWKRNGNCSTTGRDFVAVFKGTGAIQITTDVGLNVGQSSTFSILPPLTPTAIGGLLITGWSSYCPAGSPMSVTSVPTTPFTIGWTNLDQSHDINTSDGGLAYAVYGSTTPITITWGNVGGCSPFPAGLAIAFSPQ